MTLIPRAFLEADDAATPTLPAATWRSLTVDLDLSIGTTPMRLVRFENGWLASVATLDGPTLGCDASPYLAASASLAPLGIGLAEVLSALGEHAAKLAAGASDVRPRRP